MSIFEPTLDKLLKKLARNDKVFIAALWIAISRAKALTTCLDRLCSLEVWLRMNSSETDKDEMIEVLDTLKYFNTIKIYRNPSLHWKAFLCEKKGYIGSANFTERGIPASLDKNGSIEGLLELTERQLKECWVFKKELSNKMQAFDSPEAAKVWWLNQPHKKLDRLYPGEIPKETDDFPPKPKDYSIR